MLILDICEWCWKKYHRTREVVVPIARFLHSLNSHFRLRSSGERVELVHVMKDEDATLCMVESPRAGRIIVREEELELELQHVGAAIAVCLGLALAGAAVGYLMHP
jgi:hypothetical protein